MYVDFSDQMVDIVKKIIAQNDVIRTSGVSKAESLAGQGPC